MLLCCPRSSDDFNQGVWNRPPGGVWGWGWGHITGCFQAWQTHAAFVTPTTCRSRLSRFCYKTQGCDTLWPRLASMLVAQLGSVTIHSSLCLDGVRPCEKSAKGYVTARGSHVHGCGVVKTLAWHTAYVWTSSVTYY